MVKRVAGLIVVEGVICDGCGRVMDYLERYAYVTDEENLPNVRRLCEECSRKLGYLKVKHDSKNRELETFFISSSIDKVG